MPADLYYACLDGPYNYDGDGNWGEPHDGKMEAMLTSSQKSTLAELVSTTQQM